MVNIPVEIVQVVSAVLGTASLGLIAWTAQKLYHVNAKVEVNASRINRLEDAHAGDAGG